MPTHKAEAEWEGNLAQGSGRLKLDSGAFEGPYSFKSRFEEGQRIGTARRGVVQQQGEMRDVPSGTVLHR